MDDAKYTTTIPRSAENSTSFAKDRDMLENQPDSHNPAAPDGGSHKSYDNRPRLSDFLTAGELTIDNVMVGWALGDPGGIEVGPYPDYTMWSRRYRMTDGACCLAYHECSPKEKLWWLLTIYYAAVSAGVDARYAHREFSKIKEWPQAHQSPPPADPGTLEAERAARHERDMAWFGGVDPRPRPAPRPTKGGRAVPGTRFVLHSFADVSVDDLEPDQYRAVFGDEELQPEKELSIVWADDINDDGEDIREEMADYAAFLSSPPAITVTKSRTTVPGTRFVRHAASDVTVDLDENEDNA
jgi:hypothetical protein